MRKNINFSLIIILFIAVNSGLYLSFKQLIDKQQISYKQTQQDYDNKILTLQKEVKDATFSAQETQTSAVTNAVSKNINSAVSIIISQDLPEYKIAYQNPYGNDPFYQDQVFQIPVYILTGKNKVQEVGAGTGFIISSDGYILTNKHVVNDKRYSYKVLLYNGKQETAQVIYLDSKYDLAIIKIDGSNYPQVNLGDSNLLTLGQTVIAIGNALGQYNNSVSIGVVSGLNRNIKAYDDGGNFSALNGVIQTDAGLNPGNSGGPLLDLNGNVIGINVAEAEGSNNIAFSIPSNIAKTIIDKVINNK